MFTFRHGCYQVATKFPNRRRFISRNDTTGRRGVKFRIDENPHL